MPRKRSNEQEAMDTIAQLSLSRDWNCIHGVLMSEPCGMCATAAHYKTETKRLEVAEAMEDEENGIT